MSGLFVRTSMAGKNPFRNSSGVINSSRIPNGYVLDRQLSSYRVDVLVNPQMRAIRVIFGGQNSPTFGAKLFKILGQKYHGYKIEVTETLSDLSGNVGEPMPIPIVVAEKSEIPPRPMAYVLSEPVPPNPSAPTTNAPIAPSCPVPRLAPNPKKQYTVGYGTIAGAAAINAGNF
jgi:hypothetical protein